MTFDEFTQKIISEMADELRTKQKCLTFDNVPTENSVHPVTSDGIKKYVDDSVIVSGSYDSTNKKIIITLENGNTIEISVLDLVSGLQTEITSNDKLSADLVDDYSSTNKFVTSNDKNSWNNKLDAITSTSWAERVYTILTDGTQSVRYISLDSLPNSVVLRNSTGALNCSDAVYDSHAINRGYYKTKYQPKQHQIIANMNDGTDNFQVLITIISPVPILNTSALFKAFFVSNGYNPSGTTMYYYQQGFIGKFNQGGNGLIEQSSCILYDSNTEKFYSLGISGGISLTLVGIVSDTVKPFLNGTE